MTAATTEDHREAISAAIEASATQVRQYAGMVLWDTNEHPSQQQEDARKAAILILCNRMADLAQAVRSGADIRFPDYEALRAELAAIGAYPLHEDLLAIATAFGNAGRIDAAG